MGTPVYGNTCWYGGGPNSGVRGVPCLRLPDRVPPGLVRGQVRGVFRRPRVGHLGTPLVAYPRMDVQTVPGAQREGGLCIGQQPLADTDPMAEVAAQLELGESPQKVGSCPGGIEDAAAMRLVAHAQPRCSFRGQRPCAKRLALSPPPTVAAAVNIDQQRPEIAGSMEKAGKGAQVSPDVLAAGRDIDNVVETVACQEVLPASLILRLGQPSLDAIIAGGLYAGMLLPRAGSRPKDSGKA